LATASAAINNDIICEVNRSYFSEISDVFANISGKEQLAPILRFEGENVIRENFVGFLELPFVSAEAIANTILSRLKALGVDLTKRVCQG